MTAASFSSLDAMTQQRVRTAARRVCDETWRLFIECLPRKQHLEEDITPRLSSIRKDFYQKYTVRYCDLVAYVMRNCHDEAERRSTARFIYEQEMRRNTWCIRREQNVLAILQHLLPDPGVRGFDAEVRRIGRIVAELLPLEADGRTSLPHLLEGTEGERLLLEWEEQLRQRYDALEPRSKVLRRREYDGAIGMIAYVLGREGACYEMMPMGIRNQVACRLHAMDRSQEQQADGTEA